MSGNGAALVTGASRGIGRAVAGALTGDGFRVLCTSRGGDRLRDVAARCGADPPLEADLTDPEDVSSLVERVLDLLGAPPDLLVNNAGIFTLAPAHETDPGIFDRHYQLNVRAPFLLVRRFLPGMLERGRAHLVHVGSVAGRHPLPGNAGYASSKFALRGLHGVLRQELTGTGISSTLIEPGPVDTDAWNDLEDRLGSDLPARREMLHPEQVADAVLAAVRMGPLGRGGDPGEISLSPG